MSSGTLSNAGTYSLTYNLPYRFYKFVRAHPMEELSPQAQLRLSMIEFYDQVKDASVVSKTFKVSRKTFYKWFNRYRKSGKQLSSLVNVSTVPETKKKTILHFKTELDVKHLREKYITLLKIKLQKLFKSE